MAIDLEDPTVLWAIIIGGASAFNITIGMLLYWCYCKKKEQMGDSLVWNKQHGAESVKMYIRLCYNIFLWYEVIYACKIGTYEKGFDFDGRWSESKLPVWCACGFVFLFNLIEKCCFGGTRLVVALAGASWYMHLPVLFLKINWFWAPVINIALLNFKHIVWFWYWAKYGESDMSSFKVHGPFRPGLKRFKSEHGNDCLAFYPVNFSIDPREINAYRFPKKHIANWKRSGMAMVMGVSKYYHRKVNGLVEDGPIDPIFASKQKKLIPMVFCHGNVASSEEHYGVCMQMASHGFLVIAPDFTDGTALCATDRDGNDVPFSWPKGKMKKKDGTADMLWHEQFRPRFEIRINECHELGKEIISNGFAMRKLTFDVNLDTEKLMIGGHSLGGWTSIMAAEGNQNIFKVSLSMDPSHMQHQREINDNALTMKVPTCIIQSSSFLPQWCQVHAGYGQAINDYRNYLRRFSETIPNAKQRLLAITVGNSSHTEESDLVLHSQFEQMVANRIDKISMVKEQGTNMEFHEFLPMLWLDYLLKIGHHNNTYTQYNLKQRMNQFQKLIHYDHELDLNSQQEQKVTSKQEESAFLNDVSANVTHHNVPSQLDNSNIGLIDSQSRRQLIEKEGQGETEMTSEIKRKKKKKS